MELSLHAEAVLDLAGIKSNDPENFFTLFALIQEIKDSDALMARLTDRGQWYAETAEFDIDKFINFWKRGYDVWRIKVFYEKFGSLPYRIIYAYDWQDSHFHVIAVMHRDFDYEKDERSNERIKRIYRELGIPVNK